MSLKRQIILAGALIFALALFGVAVGQWLAGRDFVRGQLAAHAHETATALALSVSAALRDGDAALVKTTLLPVFDRGYYRRIAIRDPAGSIVDAAELSAPAQDVPRWFAALARLEAPRAESLVNAGWQEVGRVEVEGDPEFALRQLWQGTLRAVAWLLVVYALALVLMFAWLRRLLEPMSAVEHIAAAAALRRIEPIPLRTRVRELASFVAGFNRLAGMVNDRITEEEQRAERFRAAALIDRLTGLPNRLGLEAEAAAWPEGTWLGMVALDGIEAINRDGGYAAGDAFVVALAECVRETLPAVRVVRLHAATFALAFPADEVMVEAASRLLLAALARRAAGFGVAQPRGAAGWVPVQAGVALPVLLSAADRALGEAQSAGPGAIRIHREVNAALGIGARALLDWVDKTLATGGYGLALQRVVAVPGGEPLLREAFLRLRGPDGSMVPAQDFLPIVQRERGTAFLDRAMFGHLSRAVADGRVAPGVLAVNLSAETIAAGSLPDWLRDGLAGWPAAACPLVFELREQDVVAAPAAAERFAAAVRAGGATVALDRFGLQAGGVAAMRRLLPHYVKLDASLSHGLEAVERRFQVEALVRAARTLEIPVWAQVFETPGALELLAEMGVAGAQGFTLAPEQAVS